MRCPSCGNENREGARFCDSCGSRADRRAGRRRDASRQEPLPADVPTEIAGRYRVRRFLGQGGRKRVYLSDDTATGDRGRRRALRHGGCRRRDPGPGPPRGRGDAQARRSPARRHRPRHRRGGRQPLHRQPLHAGRRRRGPARRGGRAPRGAARGRDRGRRHPRARARSCPRHRPSRPEARERLDRRRRPRPPRRLRPGDHRGALAGQRRHAGRHGRLPAARAGARRGRGPAERPLLARGAALRDAHAASRRSRATTPSRSSASTCTPTRSRPRGTTRRCPRRSTGSCWPCSPSAPRIARPTPPRRASGCSRRSRRSRPRSRRQPRANPLESLAGGVFVGRERELERLREAVDGALAGRGSLQLLVGEPGIGKTRAAEELATYARVSGARVYWGRCREDEGAPAYWPWVQAIRSYARDADPVALAWQLGGGAAEVAQLIPEVAEKLDVEPAKGSDSEEARFRLFDSVTSLLLGGGPRPADRDRARRPALGGRALAAPAPLRGARARLERPADPRHLPRRRARPPPSARPGARRDLGHRGQRAHPAARPRRSAPSSATSR